MLTAERKYGNTGIITSRMDNGEIWVSHGGKRSKVGVRGVEDYVLVNDENKRMMNEVKKRKEQIEGLNQEIDSLNKSMERVFPK